jgi:hypothetical protein
MAVISPEVPPESGKESFSSFEQFKNIRQHIKK